MSYRCALGFEDDCEDDKEYDIYVPAIDAVAKTLQNMSVTILPDLTKGADLNNADFDASLNKETVEWFSLFKKQYAIYKRNPSVIKTLEDYYLSHPNPLLLALKLFVLCPDCHNIRTKNNLAFFVLELVCGVAKTKPNISEKCTDNMKMVVFNFIKTQGVPNLYKAVAIAYDMVKSKDIFVDKLRQLIYNHYYKDVCHWAIFLDLKYRFSIFDIPIPLIVQDKISVAEEYLEEAKHLQRDVVELLDSFLVQNSSVSCESDRIIAKYRYEGIKYDKLHTKPLIKLVKKLAKKYNIPQDFIPNVTRHKNLGCLNYLIHKRFIEKGISSDAWRELVKELLNNSKNLEYDLISSIWYNGNAPEAVYWTKLLKPDLRKLPITLQELLITNDSDESWLIGNSDIFNQNADGTCGLSDQYQQKFYTLNLSQDNIVYIDDKEQFLDMLSLLANEKYLAFDAEFKPSFKGDIMLSLIQIARPAKIYLLDVLSCKLTGDLWMKLGEIVFANDEILKLGFSLQQDLVMFEKDLPMLNANVQNCCSYLDIQDLWKAVTKLPKFSFPYKVEKMGENLSCLVELCFGKKLDKSNQCSNWSNRPLRPEQISYAALDAFCLIEIYNKIKDIYSQEEKFFDQFIDNIIAESKNKFSKVKKKMNTSKLAKQNFAKMSYENIPCLSAKKRVQEVKFICDEMLTGLCRNLRKFGIDCLVIATLENSDDCCIRIALQEGRFVLTKGQRFLKFKQYLPDGHCYKIYSNDVEEQVVEVFKHFNIIVFKEDIFSRCQVCNSNEFILFHQTEMKKLKFGKFKNNQNFGKDDEKPPKRNFILSLPNTIIFTTKITNRKKKIQFNKIPDHVLDFNTHFFVCENCGKCYWDGSHLEKVLNGPAKNLIVEE